MTLFHDIPEYSNQELIHIAAEYQFCGNVWQDFVAWVLIHDENPYSLSCENRKKQKDSLSALALLDMEVFYQAFHTPRVSLPDEFLLTAGKKNNRTEIGSAACALARELSKCGSVAAFLETLTLFYQQHGVGMLGLNKAFSLENRTDKFQLRPIPEFDDVALSDLWGYEAQKKQLADNTEAFVNGKIANNVLLFGDSGTGKSTSVKAILNEYAARGLKIIEIYKHQFQYLTELIEILRQRNYYFIIYMDDLSFEDFEIEYKYLKAVIEGGLEPRPQNVLIYATSNRRHLIKETWKDRADMEGEVHHSDTLQEKLSLADRFGVSICFTKPVQREYDQIVLHLAKQNHIALPEEQLLAEARTWAIRNGGTTGRTAKQFIHKILGTGNN